MNKTMSRPRKSHRKTNLKKDKVVYKASVKNNNLGVLLKKLLRLCRKLGFQEFVLNKDVVEKENKRTEILFAQYNYRKKIDAYT